MERTLEIREAFRTFLIDCFVLISGQSVIQCLTAKGIAQNHGNLIFYITSQSNPGEQRAAKKLQFLKKVAKMQCKPFLAEFFFFLFACKLAK